MNINEAINVLKAEKECVLRQDTPKCNRDTCGCQCCDLVQDTETVLEAYDMAIEALERDPVEIYKKAYIKGALDNGACAGEIADDLFKKLMGGGL